MNYSCSRYVPVFRNFSTLYELSVSSFQEVTPFQQNAPIQLPPPSASAQKSRYGRLRSPLLPTIRIYNPSMARRRMPAVAPLQSHKSCPIGQGMSGYLPPSQASEGGPYVLRIPSGKHTQSEPNLHRSNWRLAQASVGTQRGKIPPHKQIQTLEFGCVYRAS